MRLPIPLAPFAITVRIERRPVRPPRAQISVLGLIIVTAITAFYMTWITLPARRARFQSAERVILTQIALLNRAAEEERGRERGIRRRLELCLAAARNELGEAAKCPEGTEARAAHEHRSTLWLNAASAVPISFANVSAERVRALERREGDLQKGLQSAAKNLEKLERFARAAQEVPDSTDWQRLDLATRLAQVRHKMNAEDQKERVRAFLASKQWPLAP